MMAKVEPVGDTGKNLAQEGPGHLKQLATKMVAQGDYKMLRAQSLCSALLVCTLLAAPSALADSVTFDLDTEISGGANPQGTAPWVTLVFDDQGSAGSVLLSVSTNLINTEFISQILFNTTKAIAFGAVSNKVGTFTDPVGTYSADGFNGVGGSAFDAELEFAESNADRFGAGESFSILLTGSGLVASDFSVTTSSSKGDLFNQVHVQSIAVGPGSGKISGGPGTVIPTPAAAGAGLLLLGVMGFRRRLV